MIDNNTKGCIDEINVQIVRTENQIQKEQQINRKIEYQVKLRKLKEELKDILGV